MKWIKRKLLHLVIKWAWHGKIDYGKIYTDREAAQMERDAKYLVASPLFEKLRTVILTDATYKLKESTSEYDIIFPKAQIYVLETMMNEISKIANRRKKPVKKRTRRHGG